MGHYIIGTAGHVDHGKTALIKALTSIDCDTHKQEQERGMTINLGFSHLDLPSGHSFGIIDMPGHKDFVRTMISGANSIDIALLVIAADSGIMPQTLEHLNIIQTLGVQKIVVVLNKADLVDAELIEMAVEEIEELFASKGMDKPPIIPVSSHTKLGLDHLIETLEQSVSEIKEKTSGNTFRMYIDRFFSVKGIGSVVTGSVLSGELSEGDLLYLYPQVKEKIKVKSIQRHGKPTDKVRVSDRAALNLSGFKAEDYVKGAMLCGERLETTQMIDAELNIFNESTRLSLWSTVMFYTGTFESMAKIHLLNRDELKNGESAIVQIHLEKPTCLFPKDKFIIRNSSSDATIGGGFVLDTKPLHHRKRSEKLIRELELRLDLIRSENVLSERIGKELEMLNKAISLSELGKQMDVSLENLNKVLQEGIQGVEVYQIGEETFLLSNLLEASYEQDIQNYLEEHHKTYFLLEEGLSGNFFAGKMGFKRPLEKALLNALLLKMETKGLISKYKGTWKSAKHTASTDPKSISDLEWLEQTYLDYDLQKPVFQDIVSESARRFIKKNMLKMYLKVLEIQGKLIKHQDDYIHKQVVDKVSQQVIEHLQDKPEGINLSQFRQLVACTKKIIPTLVGILEAQKIVQTKPDGEHTNMSLRG